MLALGAYYTDYYLIVNDHTTTRLAFHTKNATNVIPPYYISIVLKNTKAGGLKVNTIKWKNVVDISQNLCQLSYSNHFIT